MKSDQRKPKTIDEYLEGFPPNIQEILGKIRKTIHKHAPGSKETINYQLPTIVIDENLAPRNGIMFGAYKKHIGFYPNPSVIERFSSELSKMGFKFEKGSIQFPLNREIPYYLIGKMTEFRVEELKEK